MLRRRMLKEFGPPEELLHNRPERIGTYARQVPMHNDDQVDPLSHLVSMAANIFAKASLDPISGHRAAETTSNGHTQASPWVSVALDVYAQASPGRLFPSLDDCLELFRCANAIRPRKTLSHLRPTPCYTARRLRPLARRRFRMRRPAFVRIRRRNPWVRFRLTRLG